MLEFMNDHYIIITAALAAVYIIFLLLGKKKKGKKCPKCKQPLKFVQRVESVLTEGSIDHYRCEHCKEDHTFPVKVSRGTR